MPRTPMRPSLIVLLTAVTAACSAVGVEPAPDATPDTSPEVATAPADVRLPPVDAVFDYQLGGAYPPADEVQVLSRDRTDRPAPGRYSICYVNAFQTQPGEEDVSWWRENHPDLLLRADDGSLIVDEVWEEPLLDISSADNRKALTDIVGRWIDGCARDGFDAVEPDNLDSFERAQGRLTPDHAAAFARLLAQRAHARHLAIAQKNTTALLPRRDRIGFDFAVVEECAHYTECSEFADAYQGRIFDIEYQREHFDTGCRAWGEELSLTLRDLDLRPGGATGHRRDHC